MKIVCLCILLFLTACDTIRLERKNFSRKELSTFEGIAMTMPYRVEVGGELSRREYARVQALIEATFNEIDSIYNKSNPESEISKLNRLQAYEIQKISLKLSRCLKKCEYMVRLSRGRFDPTIEPIHALWKKSFLENRMPNTSEIDALRPAVGWQNIILSDTTFIKRNSQTALDLGGIIKGYAVDLLLHRLKKIGYLNLFVEWGGEVRANGHHPQGRTWAVYIPDLEDLDPEHALAYVSLQNQAIATSGDDMEQWTRDDGTIFYHIINPETLMPLQMRPKSIASASVLANDCTTADALSTMLLLCQDIEEAKVLITEIQKEIPETSFWVLPREDDEEEKERK